ncbi:hypothetical protein ACQ86N_15860 [Puia sp. P3]|uniref:hypothetical protein n=1 Tax=Puia sp. P3 TaxID=3423952 RepID=UPI003D6676DD
MKVIFFWRCHEQKGGFAAKRFNRATVSASQGAFLPILFVGFSGGTFLRKGCSGGQTLVVMSFLFEFHMSTIGGVRSTSSHFKIINDQVECLLMIVKWKLKSPILEEAGREWEGNLTNFRKIAERFNPEKFEFLFQVYNLGFYQVFTI